MATDKKSGITVKSRNKNSVLRFSDVWRSGVVNAVDRELREKELLWNANLIPGRADPPDFSPTQSKFEETPTETAEFQRFLDMHFPRRKFEALRDVLDEASRSKVTTPITLYRAIFENRRVLRSASRTMNFICEQAGLRRPPLQICEACGKLFILGRQDQWHCSDRCSARGRVARARDAKRLHEHIQESMAAAGPAAVARALRYGSAEKALKGVKK
jgi:hypothetical protein